MEGSIAPTPQIRTYAAFNPQTDQLAFTARIKPEGAAVRPQIHSASGANSNGYNDPSPQTVKSTGDASSKDGEPGHDQPENPAQSASNSTFSAAKSSSRKNGEDSAEAAGAANAIEPNALPATQPIPQLVSTSVTDRSGLQANAVPAVQSSATPEPTHVLLDKPSQAASPARDISLQVAGESGQTVDIRIAARSGDLNVAVRSGDGAMAQDLRQGLGDLESRLAQSGYHAETWHPGHNGSTAEPAAPGGNSSNSSSQQQYQSGSGWSQQNRGQRDNNPSNRPRWVNQLASTLNAESTEKGNANGNFT